MYKTVVLVLGCTDFFFFLASCVPVINWYNLRKARFKNLDSQKLFIFKIKACCLFYINSLLNNFQNWLQSILYRYNKLVRSCYLVLNLFYIPRKTKNLRTFKISYFILKTGPDVLFLFNFFFSLNSTKKNLYVDVLEMFNFNPKIRFQKYFIFSSWYNFFQ